MQIEIVIRRIDELRIDELGVRILLRKSSPRVEILRFLINSKCLTALRAKPNILVRHERTEEEIFVCTLAVPDPHKARGRINADDDILP